MKKLLTIATLALLISSNCYSYTDNRIVSHIEEQGVKLPDNIKKKSNDILKDALTTAVAYEAYGFVNVPITVSGYVTYTITNHTNTDQYYWADQWMCIDDMYCSHIRDQIHLYPNDTFDSQREVYTTSQFNQKSTHEDEAICQVTGESNYYSFGTNAVHIN